MDKDWVKVSISKLTSATTAVVVIIGLGLWYGSDLVRSATDSASGDKKFFAGIALLSFSGFIMIFSVIWILIENSYKERNEILIEQLRHNFAPNLNKTAPQSSEATPKIGIKGVTTD